MTLETNRFFLRPLTETDFHDFAKTDMDAEVMNFIRSASTTLDEARINFDRLIQYGLRCPGYGAFTVRDKATQEFLGLSVIINIELRSENPRIEIGYRLLKSSWGRGVATEVAHRLIKYGFEDLKLLEIYGTTRPDHHVSQKILMKLGMQSEGLAPYYNECRIFKITADQFFSSAQDR